MRGRVLALVAAWALVLVAAPSFAVPERTITLTPKERTAFWKSDVRVGPYLGAGVGCDRDSLGCETTLIRITRPGALSVTATQGVPTDAVGGRLIIDLFHSDAKGTAGKPIAFKEQRSGGTDSISAHSLAAGFYLLEVKWFDLTVGDYTGTANYLPK